MAAAFSPDPLRNPTVPALDGLWRASDLSDRGHAAVVPTGHAALDAVLPGGGWPVGALTELLLWPGQHAEWDLLAPALARLPVDLALVLVGAPAAGCRPFGPALAGRGLAPERLLWVSTEQPHGLAWATAQALRCRDVAGVLAWLPHTRASQLRTLQVAAHQHGKLLFVVRPDTVRVSASPAPLRLWLQGVSNEAGTPSRLVVDVVKRQGPPLTAPVVLAPGPARLQAQLRASRSRLLRRRQDDSGLPPLPQPVIHATISSVAALVQSPHDNRPLDRAALAG